MSDIGRGHVFVVRGRLESIYCDAVIVPTDSDCHIESSWDQVLQGGERPNGISGFAPPAMTSSRPIWFVDVTHGSRASLDALLENLRAALAHIAEARLNTERARPLVAVPMLGVGGAGHRDDAGTVIQKLMTELGKGVNGFDVALVALEESDYAAAQAIRRSQLHGKESTHRKQKELGEHARNGGLSLLIGAGVSQGAGLPGWSELLDEVLREAGLITPDMFDELGPLDQAQYVKAVTENTKANGRTFADIVVSRVARQKQPAIGHLLLASLGCHAVVTTNYDTLYEAAVASQKGACAPTLLPYEGAAAGAPWLLKLHGDVENPSDVVLARDEFVSYDSTKAPAGALFQSVLLTSHLLAVGVSYADDNILRLTHEVTAFQRSQRGEKKPLGTVLSLGGDELRRTIWKGALDWVAIGRSSPTVGAQARDLEIFLDEVAMYASTSSSYLLDPRYGALLGDDVAVTEDLREAAAKIPPPSGGADRWEPLRAAFRAAGMTRNDEP